MNPFNDIKMWLKYELLEIGAMHEAIDKRNELQKRRNNRHQKRIDDLKELSKLENEKFTFGSVFMNRQQITNRCSHLKKEIDKCEKALYDYDELTKLATLCLANNTI